MPSAPPAAPDPVPRTDSLELQRHYVQQSAAATLNGQQPRSAEPQYLGGDGGDSGAGGRRRSSENAQQQQEPHSTQLRRLSSGDPDPIRHSFVAYDPTRLKQPRGQRKASTPDSSGRLKVGSNSSAGMPANSAAPPPASAVPLAQASSDQYGSRPGSRPSSSSGGGQPSPQLLHSSTSSSGMVQPASTSEGTYQIARIHPDSSNAYPTPSNGTGQSAYHMAVSGTAVPNSQSTLRQFTWSTAVPPSTNATVATTTTTVPNTPAAVQDPKDFTLEQMCESRTYIVAKAQALGQQGGFREFHTRVDALRKYSQGADRVRPHLRAVLVTALFDSLLRRFETDKLPTSDEALLRFAPDMMPVAGTRPKDFLMIWRMWVDWTEHELGIPTIPLVAPLIALFLLDKIVSMDDRTRLVQILDLYRQAAFDVMVTLGGKPPNGLLPQWKSDQWHEWYAMLQTGQTSLFDWRSIREACGMGLTARATPAAPPQSWVLPPPFHDHPISEGLTTHVVFPSMQLAHERTSTTDCPDDRWTRLRAHDRGASLVGTTLRRALRPALLAAASYGCTSPGPAPAWSAVRSPANPSLLLGTCASSSVSRRRMALSRPAATTDVYALPPRDRTNAG